jgi:hypothetical protein
METVPTVQVAVIDLGDDPDVSAFISAAVPIMSKSVPVNFIIDSGSSHHMVTSSSLLRDIKQTNPTSVKIGDGTLLLSRVSGSLILGPLRLTNVLSVPRINSVSPQPPADPQAQPTLPQGSPT